MLTVIEQRTCEAICSLATTLEQEVPRAAYCLLRIAENLESIVILLEELRSDRSGQPKTRDEYGEE